MVGLTGWQIRKICGRTQRNYYGRSAADDQSNPRTAESRRLELQRFRAKQIPVRVKKTRQNKNLELRF